MWPQNTKLKLLTCSNLQSNRSGGNLKKTNKILIQARVYSHDVTFNNNLNQNGNIVETQYTDTY